MSSTESIIILEKRGDRFKVFAADIDELNMFTEDTHYDLRKEWLPDVEPLKQDGYYKLIIGYGSFYEGTNPHGNRKIYCATYMCGLEEGVMDLLGGSLYECLVCQKMYRSSDGIHHVCPECRCKNKDGHEICNKGLACDGCPHNEHKGEVK